jgi:EmrB/QacA subfamily drug resistance transporter
MFELSAIACYLNPYITVRVKERVVTLTHPPRTGHPAPTAGLGHRWPTLLLLSLAQFMVILDVSVVNIALPDMARDLSLTGAQLTWVATAYTVCLGGLMLLGGRLADLLGRRRLFLAGLLTFTAASLRAGRAGDATTILTARAAQGIGAALLSPAALAILTTTFHGPARGRALAVWGAIGGGGAAVGVLAGGLLTSGPGWAWIFFVNVPVGLLVAVVVPFVIPGGREPSGAGRLDVPGAVLVTAATAALIFGVVRIGGTNPASGLVAIGAAAVLYATFVVVERRSTRPLIDLRLFRQRAVVAGTVVMLIATALLVSAFFLSSLLLQRALGLSALQTGLVFLPVAIGTVAGAHTAGRLIGRIGPRYVAATAFALAAAGLGLLSAVDVGDSVWIAVMPAFVLAATALGATLVTATTTALSTVDIHAAGATSGTVNTAHELGAAVGVAAASAIAGVAAGSTAHYDVAFWAIAALAAVAALLASVLVPAGPLQVSAETRFVH